jgi:hypothetical protein
VSNDFAVTLVSSSLPSHNSSYDAGSCKCAWISEIQELNNE